MTNDNINSHCHHHHLEISYIIAFCATEKKKDRMKSFIKQSDGQQRLYRLLWLCFIKIESQVYERNFSNKADRSVIRSAPFYSQPKESLIFIANVSRKRNTEQKKL